MHTDTTYIGVPSNTIESSPQCKNHEQWIVAKSGPIFGKIPLDVFEPAWDGTAFSTDPYIARAIRDSLAKGLDTVTDCGDQFPRIAPSGSPKENQSFVESARIFSVVLEPGWLQRIADAQVLHQSLAPYKSFDENPQLDVFEYRT